MSKLAVKLVSRAESVKCKDCKKGINLDEKFVFCTEQVCIKYCNQTCPEAVEGECEVYEEDLEKIIDIYLSNKEMIEILKEQNEAIKKLLITEIDTGSEIVGKYDVRIVRFVQKRLDTEKVREYLDSLGVLEDYLKETEVVYPKIKKL